MLIQCLDCFVSLEALCEFEESKVVEAIFVFFKTELGDFAILFEQSSDLILNFLFLNITIQVSQEALVTIRIFPPVRPLLSANNRLPFWGNRF